MHVYYILCIYNTVVSPTKRNTYELIIYLCERILNGLVAYLGIILGEGNETVNHVFFINEYSKTLFTVYVHIPKYFYYSI